MFEQVGRMLCYIVCATIVYMAMRVAMGYFGHSDIESVSYFFGYVFGVITWNLAGVFQR
jgi:hypothetical protein